MINSFNYFREKKDTEKSEFHYILMLVNMNATGIRPVT